VPEILVALRDEQRRLVVLRADAAGLLVLADGLLEFALSERVAA